MLFEDGLIKRNLLVFFLIWNH